MKHYEGMFILHNRDPGGPREAEDGAEDAEVAPASPEDVMRALIEKAGGKVAHALLWANRKLAYPIKGNQTGTYVLCYFSGESPVCAALTQHVRLSERILRQLVLTIPALPDESELPSPLAEPVSRGVRRFESTIDTKVEGETGTKKIWEMLDYKHPFVLRRMISAQGKLFSRVRSGLEAKSQRQLRQAVYRARNMALLPFVGR